MPIFKISKQNEIMGYLYSSGASYTLVAYSCVGTD